jgi:hypothetical protein
MARQSLRVCEELTRRGARVEVLRTETGAGEKLPALDSALTVYPPANFTVEFLASHFDLCVVNVSDVSERQRDIEIVRKFQSVTVFHGFGGVGHGTAFVLPDGLSVHPAELGWAAGLASLSTGAVVHDDRYLEAIRRLCVGPVAAISPDLGDPEVGRPAAARGAGTNAVAPSAGGEGCVEKYVDALLEVLDEALRRAPLRNAGWTIGATVAEMGLAWDDPLSSRLGNEMSELFEGNRRG